MSAGNGSQPGLSPHVGKIVLIRDDDGWLRRWRVVAERQEDGTVWVGIRPA